MITGIAVSKKKEIGCPKQLKFFNLVSSYNFSVGQPVLIDNKANSVQLHLQLPTVTELGNKNSNGILPIPTQK